MGRKTNKKKKTNKNVKTGNWLIVQFLVKSSKIKENIDARTERFSKKNKCLKKLDKILEN